MNKLLIITYHFPPDKAIGGRRPFRFARYLPNEGWQVSVLTVTEDSVESYDPTAYLSLIPECQVIRVKPWPSYHDMVVKVKRLFGRISLESSVGNIHSVYPASGSSQQRNNSKGFKPFREFKRFVGSMMCIPDWRNSWVLPAYFRAKHLLKEEHFDAILTTGPPHSVHLVGLLLSRRFSKLAWVADFRDPWLGGNHKPDSIVTNLSRRVETLLAQSVCHKADLILAVTATIGRLMTSMTRENVGHKIRVLMNGFDVKMLPFHSSPKEPNGKFKIAHLGTLYYNRSPENFFMALRDFVIENQLGSSDIEVRLVGHADTFNGKSVWEMRKEHSLEDIVKIEPPVTHKESLRIMIESDVLLLFAQGQYMQIPGKVYEYLFGGKPILALCEKESETGMLVEHLKAGVVIEPHDTREIMQALQNLYATCRKKSARNGTRETRLREFLPDFQAGVLAGLLSDVLKQKS